MDPSDSLQGSLFPESRPLRPRDGRIAVGSDAGNPVADATVLDRVHAQAGGHSQALRTLTEAEQVQRGGDFLRLANSLSALYPPGGVEKRLLDAMLLAAPR